MKIKIEAYSHINAREQNQDTCGSAINKSNNTLIVLADGMGGHSNGKFCANFFLNNFIDCFKETSVNTWNNGNPFNWIEKTFQKLKKELYDYVLKHNMLTDMGTTMVGVIIINWTAFCFNIGDSRCYIMNPTLIKKITIDQVVGSYPELKHLGNPVQLTSALGPKNETTIDFFYTTINKNMVIALTSDGIHGVISDEKIYEALFTKKSDLKVRTQLLVNNAIIQGSKDNATCISLEFE